MPFTDLKEDLVEYEITKEPLLRVVSAHVSLP